MTFLQPRTTALTAVMVVACLCTPPQTNGQSPGVPILTGDSLVRVHARWQTPVYQPADGHAKPFAADRRTGKPFAQYASPALPEDWTHPAFDDRSWARQRTPLICGTSGRWETANEFSQLAVRGKFKVADPQGITDLRLTVAYRGGVVIYVNGKEVKRAHLPAGPDALADPYPPDAYVTADNQLLSDAARDGKGAALRVRRIENLAVPPSVLQPGTNVLAVLAVRAPVLQVALDAKHPTRRGDVEPVWAHCGIEELSLSANPGSPCSNSAARPPGVQLWSVGPLDTVAAWHLPDPCEPPAMNVVGTRNGSFSGRFVIASADPLRGVKVTPGDLLADSGAKLAASNIKVRYAAPARPQRSWLALFSVTGAGLFDDLLDRPPETVPVNELKIPDNAHAWPSPWSHPRRPPAPAAMLPVWVTVNVPADAAPGVYRGFVTASAAGLAETPVPLTIKVNAWRLSDPDDFVTANNFYNSHDSVAKVYGVELWSDKHFELMGKNLAIARLVASRLCLTHLIVGANAMGNSESMVRWIDRGGGRYDYDFSVFDRYLDLCAANVGKPRLLEVSVWTPDSQRRPITVSRLDPATGKVEPMEIPDYGTPESLAFWRPVLNEVRKRIEKRGWWDVTCLGTPSDATPDLAAVGMFRSIWPDGRWVAATHMAYLALKDDDGKSMPVYFGQRVWGVGGLYDPDGPRHGSYPRRFMTTPDRIETVFPRLGQGICTTLIDGSRLALWRMAPEASLQGNVHGIGRIGLDFWPIPGRRRGRFDSLAGGSNLGPSAATMALVGAADGGPVMTQRLEMFREGVQTREAMIYILSALGRRKLGADLVRRCTELLDDRARHYLRTYGGGPYNHWIAFEGSNWQQRDDALFALAAEVERAQ